MKNIIIEFINNGLENKLQLKEKSSVGETITNVKHKEKNVITETFVADISKPLPQEWDWWNTEDDDVWDKLYGGVQYVST